MLPSFNLEHMHKSWSHLSTKLWNGLPTRVRECPDLAAFRRALLSFMARLKLCPIITDQGGWARHIGVLNLSHGIFTNYLILQILILMHI